MFKKFFNWIKITAVMFGAAAYHKISACLVTSVTEAIDNPRKPPLLAIVIDTGLFIMNTYVFSIIGKFINYVVRF